MEALTSEKATDLIQTVHEKIAGTRSSSDARYPEQFIEIIQIFRQTREGFIKIKDGGDTVILEVEIEAAPTLPIPELHLKITRDTRGLLSKVFGKGKSETKIFVFTATGYKTATEETLSSQRYFQGTNKRKESPYTTQSYINLSSMINQFHAMLQKSSTLKMHSATTQTPP